jgi:hypothetical protein
MMAEVLVEFSDVVLDPDGRAYSASACGSEMPGGMWQGWIEFSALEPGGKVIRSGRETTQPNRQDAVYWATGLTAVYLEGALERALNPPEVAPVKEAPVPAYDGPAPPALPAEPLANGVLDPFSVYRKGEIVLRRQLAAMSAWHLVNIIRAHALSEQSDDELGRLTDAELVELIIAGVKVERQATSRE